MVLINKLLIHSPFTKIISTLSSSYKQIRARNSGNSVISITIKIMEKDVAKSSPLERNNMVSYDNKLNMAKHCSQEGVVAGAKAAVVASIVTAIPTMASARMLPWARANLNYTAQALIISTVAGAAYFIVADKTILAAARRNSFNQHAAFQPNNNAN